MTFEHLRLDFEDYLKLDKNDATIWIMKICHALTQGDKRTVRELNVDLQLINSTVADDLVALNLLRDMHD